MFFDYRDNLEFLHQNLNPKVYLEIGVETGRSLILAKETTCAIGVDPNPVVRQSLDLNKTVYKMTSDDFFAQKVDEVLQGRKIDLAFIDGMHNFEYVLRDFINVEKYSNNDSVITVHDILPADELTSRRVRETGFWTGDVFKFVMILKKYRPDLKFYNSDIPPAGLAIISNLDPKSTVLVDNYDLIVEEFMDYPYEKLEINKREILSINNDQGYKDYINQLNLI